ncbi:hypothetical protein THRCLA_22697 [Thraustotheca clavata]|uniref:Uncharacterized protein n=1 Tax=Thraustotheca clavata TaxID=74557 RepID=A0A1V9YUF8_9STRA|nr:hypothetical protein THRCLA_22697 [Thraustotheca clavata]
MSDKHDVVRAIENSDIHSITKYFKTNSTFTHDELEAFVKTACLSGSYQVFSCLIAQQPFQLFLNGQRDTTNVLYRLMNAATQGGNVDIMTTFSRLSGIKWQDVHEDQLSEHLTPLLIASIRGDTDAMQFLVDEGVDPNNGTTRDGNAPIAMAAAHGFTDAVEILLDAGASVDLRNNNGESAQDLALLYNYEDIVQLFYQASNHRALEQVDGETIKTTISKLRQAKNYTNYAVRERENIDFNRVQNKISKLKARIHGCIDHQ